MTRTLPIAKSAHEICLLPGFANRHGLITGATGTGKTVTLQTMAEAFSSIGVPVFMADVKGDLAGRSQAGAMNPRIKGNRIQPALRAFTPRDQKAVKTAATTLRSNPDLDVEKAITELGIGEALVSLLDEKGRPSVVQRAFVLPPRSRLGPVTPDERTAAIKRSLMAGIYEALIDRESAHEVLTARREQSAAAAQSASTPATAPASGGSSFGGLLGSVFGGGGSGRQSAGEALIKSAVRAAGSEVGRRIIRGVLGSILGGSGRRR